MKKVSRGGGWPAIRYAWQMARKSGGLVKFIKALSTSNACKTCALGMGGQEGGMIDESRSFPEVCKKSMQAMAADMQGGISPSFFAQYGFEQLKTLSPYDLEHLGRLTHPLYAGPDDTHYRVIEWQEALDRASGRLSSTDPNRSFFYCSGRSSNEAAFVLHLFARLYGTNNVNNCSYYCHQASGVGLASALGTGTATIVLEDLDRCDTVFLIGGNPASNHPRLMRRLVDLRRRGGDVIVINPLKETGLVNFAIPSDLKSLLLGSEVASLYLQPHIGGDIAVLTGIQKYLVEAGALHQSFMADHTEGADAWIEHVRQTSWDDIEHGSGLDRQALVDVGRKYARSRNAVFCWTMGITHHRHGSDNVRAIANTALCRGMIGRPGAGLLPIRGHSNVQGVGSVGVTPALKKVVFDRLESHFGVTLPTSQGMDTLACMEAMHTGELATAWCLGGNLYGANPDLAFAEAAFNRLESVTYFSTTMNTGHAWGRARETLVLPVLARDEEPQTTTQESMFNFVRLSEGGQRRHQGPRSEVELVATLADRVLGDTTPIDWKQMKENRSIREAIAAVVPGYEQIENIDTTKHEFQISGRTYHEPRFQTPSGKANIKITPIPALLGHDGDLRLMTIRSEGQFNTVVYEEHDLYRNQERRDVILMNAEDMARMGLQPNQPVSVQNQTGTMRDILARPFDIKAGNAAMYFPEANILVDRIPDPESRTPSYKGVVVTVAAQSSDKALAVERPRAIATSGITDKNS
ncbi:MAG: FdhF/YdeP family oxidoreductase [Planctomycetota bacterium]